MGREPSAEVVELVEGELWFPPRRALRRAADWLLDSIEIGPRRERSVLLDILVTRETTGATFWALLAIPAYFPVEAAARVGEAADRRRLRALSAERFQRLEALVGLLDAVRGGPSGAAAGHYRESPVAADLAAAPPEVLRLLDGGAARLARCRVSTTRDWPDEHVVHGLVLAATEPAALLAHLWDDGDEALVEERARALEACLGRCLPSPLPLERWSWKLGESATLRVARRQARRKAGGKRRDGRR